MTKDKIKGKKKETRKNKENPYRSWYPNDEKLSKNPITKRAYRKIRECFKWHYIEKSFSEPMYPREQEFLQWIKKFLNDMEKGLLKEIK